MNDTPPSLLNATQRRIVGAATTALSVIILLFTVYGVFLLLREFITTFQDVLLPLAFAMILATLLRPVVELIGQHTRLNRVGSIAAIYVIFALFLLLGSFWLFPTLFEQLKALTGDALGYLQTKGNQLASLLRDKDTELGRQLSAYMDEAQLREMTSYAEKALSGVMAALSASGEALLAAGSGLAGFLGTLAMWLVVPIYLVFLLNTDEAILPKLKDQLSFIPKRVREDMIYLIREFSDIIIAYFRGQVTIAVLTGVMLAIGFTLVGLKAGLLIGFVAGLANLIPYLGTTLGILTILPYAYYDGGWGQLATVAIVFAIAQFIQDYVLTPKIMGERTGLGPMTIIFAIFFWGVALGGMLGVILAIPLTAFFIVFWRLAKTRYLPNYQCGETAPPFVRN